MIEVMEEEVGLSDLEMFQKGLEGASEEQLAAMAAQSPAVHFTACVRIYDKNNDLIEPLPNILQLRMSEAYEVCMELGIACRMVVLKPRQVGCSTFGQHIVYHHGQRYKTDGITISDKGANSAKLMLKMRDYGVDDRFPWGTVLKREAGGWLEWSNGTKWEIESAENWKAGIGTTRQAFHASEVPKWPKTGIKNDKRVMAAVMPSISKGRSVVIAEGTPEGATGWFYEQWHGDDGSGRRNSMTLEELLEARESGEDLGVVWIRVFAAWFEFEEHARPVSAKEIVTMRRTLGDREKEGVEKEGWSWEQVAWRRDMIRTECGGDEDTFDEYYPGDDVRCFAVAGRPRFNMSSLMAMESRCKSMASEVGHVVGQEDGSVSWNPRDDGGGDVQVWERPREGMRYLVGCDPATGASQTVVKDPDRSSIQVWRQAYYDPATELEHRARLVARVRAPYFGDADEVSGQIARLSRWYGHCIAVVEVNLGIQIIELLKLAGVPLYKRVVPSERLSGSLVEQIGWKLKDVNQRRSVVEALATALREQVLDVGCLDWIREAKCFVTAQNGKDEARAGEHDDDVLCGAMCYYALPSATLYKPRIRRRRRPKDWHHWNRVGDVTRRNGG